MTARIGLTRRSWLWLCGSLALPCAAQGLTISGTVRSAEGPLAATVTLRGATGGQRITEANREGEFAFSGLDNGPYRLTVEMSGYRTATMNVALTYDKESGEVEVTLVREARR